MLHRRHAIRKPDSGSRAPPAREGWDARLARMRDLALIGFGFVYAFGYAARALHAWENNLGVLPGVELQYFVAGLILLIPPAIVFALLWGLWRSMQLLALQERESTQLRKWVDRVFATAFVLGMLLGPVLGDVAWLKERLPWVSGVAVTLLLASFVGFFVLTMARDRSSPLTTRAQDGHEARGKSALALTVWVSAKIGKALSVLIVLYAGLIVILLLVAAMLLGAAKVLPLMPQALGGGAPRCAQFDLDRGEVSAALAALLTDKSAVDGGGKLMRTRPVWVYYSGTDAMLFKPPEAHLGAHPTYELRRAAINAIVWCRDIP